MCVQWLMETTTQRNGSMATNRIKKSKSSENWSCGLDGCVGKCGQYWTILLLTISHCQTQLRVGHTFIDHIWQFLTIRDSTVYIGACMRKYIWAWCNFSFLNFSRQCVIKFGRIVWAISDTIWAVNSTLMAIRRINCVWLWFWERSDRQGAPGVTVQDEWCC